MHRTTKTTNKQVIECDLQDARTTSDTINWKITVFAVTLRTEVAVSGKCLISRLAVQVTTTKQLPCVQTTSPISLPFYSLNNSLINQTIGIMFSTQHPEEAWQQKHIMCPPHIQTVAIRPWQVQKQIIQLHSTTNSIFFIISIAFYSIHHFKPVNDGTLLAYITVNVQSDVILSQLQQHLLQRWTAFQQCIVDELVEQRRIQTPWFYLCILNTGCNVG